MEFNKKSIITRTWVYDLIHRVIIPQGIIIGVVLGSWWLSILFGHGDQWHKVMTYKIVDQENLQVNLLKIDL